MAPPGWMPPESKVLASPRSNRAIIARLFRSAERPVREVERNLDDLVERAAGTGLTGHSSQRFVTVAVGPLEAEATIVRLRIVIGTDEAFAAPRPLHDASGAPARPAARP